MQLRLADGQGNATHYLVHGAVTVRVLADRIEIYDGSPEPARVVVVRFGDGWRSVSGEKVWPVVVIHDDDWSTDLFGDGWCSVSGEKVWPVVVIHDDDWSTDLANGIEGLLRSIGALDRPKR